MYYLFSRSGHYYTGNGWSLDIKKAALLHPAIAHELVHLIRDTGVDCDLYPFIGMACIDLKALEALYETCKFRTHEL